MDGSFLSKIDSEQRAVWATRLHRTYHVLEVRKVDHLAAVVHYSAGHNSTQEDETSGMTATSSSEMFGVASSSMTFKTCCPH
jgi:hypothetical protein